MKLVELLAKELDVWPEGYRAIVQSSAGLTLPIDSRDVAFENGQWDYVDVSMDIYHAEFACSQLATDHATAIITREMWEAERNQQEKEEMTPCEELGYKIGDYFVMTDSSAFQEGDILKLEWDDETACPRFARESDGQKWYECLSFVRKITKPCDATPTPYTHRDTIIHCQAIIEDCERDIAVHTEALASEGFKLIGAPHSVDLGDWQNWEEGLLLRCIKSDAPGLYTVGKNYAVKEMTDFGALVYDDLGGGSVCRIGDEETSVRFTPE